MNHEQNNSIEEGSGAGATTAGCPECATLKLLAREEPPAGLEQRVLSRLRAEATMPRQTWWQMRAVWVGGVTVAVVMATAWVGLFHTGAAVSRDGSGSVPTAHAAQPTVPGPHAAGSFGTAGSMRVPPTVKPMYISPAPRRSAGSPGAVKPKAAQKKTTGVHAAEDSPR